MPGRCRDGARVNKRDMAGERRAIYFSRKCLYPEHVSLARDAGGVARNSGGFGGSRPLSSRHSCRSWTVTVAGEVVVPCSGESQACRPASQTHCQTCLYPVKRRTGVVASGTSQTSLSRSAQTQSSRQQAGQLACPISRLF